MTGWRQIQQKIALHPDTRMTFTLQRGDGEVTIPVTTASVELEDRFGNRSEIGRIGIMTRPLEYKVVPVGPIEAIGLGFSRSWDITRMMVIGIKQIVVGDRSVKELGGPIKIAKFSGEQLSLGWPEFVSFAALISLNLAFINLLPIPALDGGHLAFYAAEAIRRRPASQRSQEWAFRTGIAFVLALMLFVTINDIASLPIFGG
jgi:regulator of sigma E protease